MLLPRDSVINYYDLSNDCIQEMPDLSSFYIKILDISDNVIDTFTASFFPKGIHQLDFSRNCLKKRLYISNSDFPMLIELDLSGNCLEEFKSSCDHLRKLDLSNNNLIIISLISGKLEYIDISNNPGLSNIVDFPHRYIDTVIYQNIANDKPLVSRFELPFSVE